MAVALAAIITLLATLGAVALGGRISRRNEQQQWLRDECKRVYLEFLHGALDLQVHLKRYQEGATSNPTYWQSTSSGTPHAWAAIGSLSGAKGRLDRAREETLVFGDLKVDASQQLLYKTIVLGVNGTSSDERTAKTGLAAVERCIDELDGAIGQYTQAIRKSFGR